MLFLEKKKVLHVDENNYNKLFLKTFKSVYFGKKKKVMSRILLMETLNNFYINLLDEEGKTLIFKSAGLSNKHRTRTSIQTVEDLTLQFLDEIRSMRENVQFVIYLKSPYNTKMRSVVKECVRQLRKSVYGIVNKVSVPHNGVRGRKLRRK